MSSSPGCALSLASSVGPPDAARPRQRVIATNWPQLVLIRFDAVVSSFWRDRCEVFERF